MKRNIYTLVRASVFVMLSVANTFIPTAQAQTSTPPSAGDGSSANPYQIATLANLYWITQNSSSWSEHFIQTADIDASSDTSWDSNQGFSPIGSSGTKFTGVYDGSGHTIAGIFISRSSANYLGMFAFAEYPDTIENLGLINLNIIGSTYTGGLVGFNYDGSTVINCHSTGSISASYADYIGGLVGSNNASTVSNSYSTVNITGNSADADVGGLVGYNFGLSTVNNCYSTGSVTNGGSDVGGLVGYNYPNGGTALISNSYSIGKVSGTSDIGGLVGDNAATIDSCFWNTDSSGSTGIGTGTTTGATGKTTAGMKDPSTFTSAGWDTASWYMGDSVNNGYPYLSWQYPSGTHLVTAVAPSSSGGYYLIASLDNLYWITQNSSSWGSSFKQTADIDASQTSGWASGSGFSPIGHSGTYFSGTYDGNGHTISNLFISRSSTSAVGFIGYPNSSGSITRLGLVNVNIRGQSYVGGVVGDCSGTVSDCYSTGTVSGSSSIVGGLVGGVVEGTISNSYSTASVNGSNYVGGLVGYLLEATVTNCYSTGSSNHSGLVGYSGSSTVNNSFWDTQTSGQSSSNGGTGETTSAMKTESTFTNAGWDFTNTWAIDDSVNDGYPGLVWQSQYAPAAPTAVTNAGTSAGFYSATLNGTVAPYKGTTTVKFIYGTISGNYPDTITASQSPLSGWGVTLVSASASGLTPNRTYYYRVIASSSYGSAEGSEVSFTTTSLPTLSTTVPGTALSFNSGSSQYISVPDNASLELTNNLTFEAWVYPTGSGNMAIIDKGNYNYLFEIRPNSNTGLGLYNAAWGWIYSSGTVPLYKWSHVAVVFQTGTNGVKFYLNGSLLSEATASGALTTNTGTFAIGEQAPGNCNCNFFQGEMDEVSVWNVPRTEQQIRDDMYKTLTRTETGLVSYWQFNEGSGTTANDLVGGNNGTLTNGPTWVTSEAPVGKYGTYDGTTSGDTTGQSGSTVTGSITSTVDSLDFLGLYSYGSPTDTVVTTETFPSGVNKRSPVIWGIFAVGSDTANVTLNYGGLGGIQNEGGLKVLEREEADSPWVDVTTNFTQDQTNHRFTETGVHTFSQFAIGAGGDNSLPVQATDFLATTDIGSVTLSWKTQSEVSIAGFNVLRQDPGTPLFNLIASYKSTDSLKGLGTSSTGRSYDFTDNHVVSGATYQYKIQSVSTNGITKDLSTLSATVDVPKTYALYQNYPNPFNPSTTIRFDLKEQSKVTLDIYNVLGQRVLENNYGTMNAGRYNEVVNMEKFASGVYFYRISAVGNNGQKFLSMKKMLEMK